MAEIIDFATMPQRICAKCFWHDAPNGACTRPGGYQFDWKNWYCHSFRPKDSLGPKGGTRSQ